MYFVLYSNKKYEYMVEAFIASRKYAGTEDVNVVFYTVGYDSDLEYPNLIKKRWDPLIERENFQFYKPHIMLQSLEFDSDMIYFDCDILLGKRFVPDTFLNLGDYPLACAGPLEFVSYWEKYPDGQIIEYDERMLKEYYSVQERTTYYLWTSMLSYGPACRDFLQEWCSIVDNSYFHRDGLIKYYMPFGDETPFNVLMWKRKCQNYLPRHFVNTTMVETLKKVELDDNYQYSEEAPYGNFNPNPSIYERCDSSSLVQFYHGMKDKDEIIKTLSWMMVNS